ncbi:hypothetical protein MKEN_00629600 [Mycena kentingensis (nom. inval.)]|nr:hypothetical protein MKEN_00629600 [Mycena kentingensis (nom. inval.)]
MSVSALPPPPQKSSSMLRQPQSMPNTPAVYPTTTTAGWTVVHHGTLGPPEAYGHASSSSSSAPFGVAGSSSSSAGSIAGRRSHSQNAARLPISSGASAWRPPAAKDPNPRPLPVPPPLDTVSVGSTTFTRRPGRGQSSERERDHRDRANKRSASTEPSGSTMLPALSTTTLSPAPATASASAISPATTSALSPLSTTASRPLPLPPPAAGPAGSSSNALAGPSSSSSRHQHAPKTKSSAKPHSRRAHTPETGRRVANPSQERVAYPYSPPTAANPATTRSPTMPFDGVSGVWAPRPAADSHPPRSSSKDRPQQPRTRTTSGSSVSDARPSLTRKSSGGVSSASPSSSASGPVGKQPSLTNLRRKTSVDVPSGVDYGLPILGRSPSLQRIAGGGIMRSTTSASGSGAISPRKSSLSNTGIRTAASSPAHSRNPSLSTPPLIIPTYSPPSHSQYSSVPSATSPPSAPLPSLPPQPPLLHPVRQGTLDVPPPPSLPNGQVIIPMGPAPKSFVAPPPPPPLPLATATATTPRSGPLSAGSAASAGSTASAPRSGSAPSTPSAYATPPPPPPPPVASHLQRTTSPTPPPLKMSAVLLGRRDPATTYTSTTVNSPGTYTEASTPSSARSAPPGFTWRYSTDTTSDGSPMTGLTTPATSHDGGKWERDKATYAGSPLASLPSPGPGGKRERRRLQLHSPVDINIPALTEKEKESPIHSHPIASESEEGAERENAAAAAKRAARATAPWLAALEGEVGEEEMDGVLLSPPTFASRKLDPDEMDENDIEALDLYDDGVDETFDDGADRGRRGRSPSPIRYARRASVDQDMIFSDSSDEEELDEGGGGYMGDTASGSVESPAASLNDAKSTFNDARSTFSRAKSTRSRRKWRNTRAAPPPVPLASAAGMGMGGNGNRGKRRHQRSHSADSSIIGFGVGAEGMAPSAMYKLEMARNKALEQNAANGFAPGPAAENMRFMYQANKARLPASVPPPPPLLMMSRNRESGSITSLPSQYAGGGYADSAHGHGSGSVSGHGHGGSSESGGGGRYGAYQPSPTASKNSLPLPGRKEGGIFSRKDKKDKFRKTIGATPNATPSSNRTSFSLLRRGPGEGGSNSSAEVLMVRNGAGPGRVSSSSTGSDERRGAKSLLSRMK